VFGACWYRKTIQRVKRAEGIASEITRPSAVEWKGMFLRRVDSSEASAGSPKGEISNAEDALVSRPGRHPRILETWTN